MKFIMRTDLVRNTTALPIEKIIMEETVMQSMYRASFIVVHTVSSKCPLGKEKFRVPPFRDF